MAKFRFTQLTQAVFLIVIPAIAVSCSAQTEGERDGNTIRVATFNVSFHRSTAGALVSDLRNPFHQQAQRVARVLRIVRPDVVLLNEFDHDGNGEALQLFQKNFLEPQTSADSRMKPLKFQYSYVAAVNTGLPSGFDLNRDGKTDGPADNFGFGAFPGQYGMAVLSRFPIDQKNVRTFQKLLWKQLPKALAPVDPSTGRSWYSPEAWNGIRLSSKSHWDLPIRIDGRTLHVLASHPTPPAFDGPENRNGRRNHDEIRLWAEYLSNEKANWLVDDKGKAGGLPANESFVILGDLNSDPFDGDSLKSIQQLLSHPRINATFTPESKGAVEATAMQKGKNVQHKGDSKFDTADFGDAGVGNLRVDYVLPGRDLNIQAGAVFWPTKDNSLNDAIKCSDHRLVWLDLSWN